MDEETKVSFTQSHTVEILLTVHRKSYCGFMNPGSLFMIYIISNCVFQLKSKRPQAKCLSIGKLIQLIT